MKIPGMIDWQRLRGVCLSLILLCLTLLPSSCGDGQQGSLSGGSDETASANLTIRWHDTSVAEDSAPIRAASLGCQAAGVEQVVCEVYDAAGNWLVTGGPWACEAGSGMIERIPVGQDRIFVVLAEDDLGNIRYQGETFGVSIEAGQNNQDVVIEAYPFIPTLSAPENAAQDVDLSAVSLEWEPVENAEEYLIQVAKDVDFETIIINETTPTTVYTAPLEPLTEYFWKICAVDMQTNTGADSEVRSFVTSDCTYTISPASNAFTNTGSTASIDVTSPSSHCPWSVSVSASWITITSDSSGSGNGMVTYSVSANPGAARSATITIADQDHTVTQEAAPCTYTISPPSKEDADKDGDAYNITVSATHSGCEWRTSESESWFSLSPTSGSGSGTVRVTALANPGAARSATITIAGQDHTVTQEAAPCTYTVSPPSKDADINGDAYDITVSATHSGCAWSTSESESWFSLSPTSGSGSGTVHVTALANPGATRSATITIADQTHTINQ